MAQTSEIVLGILALMISLYGGLSADFTSTILGILLIFLTITLRFNAREDDMNLLKSEIHIHYELQKIWAELERLKHAKPKY